MKLNKIFLVLLAISVMASISNAFEIKSPEAITYFDNEIQLEIKANQTLDTINYSIDNGLNISACYNCSDFKTNLNLSFGNHTLNTYGALQNEVYSDSVSFEIKENQTQTNQSNQSSQVNYTLTINKPENIKYNTSIIDVGISSDKTLDNISIKLDDNNYQLFCSNCSAHNATINVSEGNHTLQAKGSLSGIEKQAFVNFAVAFPPPQVQDGLHLAIISPQPRNYTNKKILFNFSANINSTINFLLDNHEYNACINCSSFTKLVNLQTGNHTLTVNAILGNLSDSQAMNFSIMPNLTKAPGNETKNNTDARKFTKGLNNLPKLLEKGEISDHELAEIIRHSKINPGIINRLIKTGKLGDESIGAILETQFKPNGILKKILKLLGINQKTHAELIYENYNLTLRLEYKLLSSDDISEDYAEKIEKKLDKEIELEIEHENETDEKLEIEEENHNKTDKDKQKLEAKAIKKELKEESKENKVYKTAKQNGKSRHYDEDDEDSEKELKSNHGNKDKKNKEINNGIGKHNDD